MPLFFAVKSTSLAFVPLTAEEKTEEVLEVMAFDIAVAI